MIVYVQANKNIFEGGLKPININFANALFGFEEMGWEYYFFEGEAPENRSRNDVVVGYISTVKKAVKSLGIEPPSEIDYPEELKPFYGRKIWKEKMDTVSQDRSMWPVFIKPVKGKQFDGRVVSSIKDLIGCNRYEGDEAWCSEVVNYVSEWRCFVKRGQIVDVRRYKGSLWTSPEETFVRRCIEEYKSQPAAFSLDIGLTAKGEMQVIEVNDAYSLGSYGLNYIDYAKILSARWSEIVNVPDPCQF